MSGTTRYNGQIPTDPAAIAITLLTLYLLISLLSPEQLAALGLAGTFLPIITPYLPQGGR